MKISVPLLPHVKVLGQLATAMTEAAAAADVVLPAVIVPNPGDPFTLTQCNINLAVGGGGQLQQLTRLYAHIVPGRQRLMSTDNSNTATTATVDGPELRVTLAVPPEMLGTRFSMHVTRFLLDGRGEEIIERAAATRSEMGGGWGEAASATWVGFPLTELLVEEAILVVLTIDLETEIYRISDRHAIISEDVRRAQEQWLLLYSTVHQYKINCCKSLAKIVPRDC